MSYKVVKQESLVEEKLSLILKLLFAGEKQMTWEGTENNGSPGYSNFRTLPHPHPPPPKNDTSSWYIYASSQGMTVNVLFVSR